MNDKTDPSQLVINGFSAEQLTELFHQGAVFAYPTEAVFGVGCDPLNELAVKTLLKLKNRPQEKGLILVASNYSQLLSFVDDKKIPMDRRSEIFSSWPGPNTWLLPKSSSAPNWITGDSDFIAVRVTAHPLVRVMCDLFAGPLVSTSANITGNQPAKTKQQVFEQFNPESITLIDGALGESAKPTSIRNSLTGETIRAS